MRSTAEDVHMASPSEPDLNQLFAAALEFGPNWRKPVGELASTDFPEQPQEYRDAIAAAVEEAHSATEEHVEATHVRLAGRWARGDDREADAWIADRFPWMTKQNRRRALRQGQYYAWHDHG